MGGQRVRRCSDRWEQTRGRRPMVLSCACRPICCRSKSRLSTNHSCTYHYSSTYNHPAPTTAPAPTAAPTTPVPTTTVSVDFDGQCTDDGSNVEADEFIIQ